MLRVVLSQPSDPTPLWIWAVLLAPLVSIAVVLVGFGLRESVRATRRAGAVGAAVVLPAGLAIEYGPVSSDPLLAGLLFAPAFALVYGHGRDSGFPAQFARGRTYRLALLVAVVLGLLVSSLWLLIGGVGSLTGGTRADVATEVVVLSFGYGATGLAVCGYVGYRILCDARRRVVSGRAANVR